MMKWWPICFDARNDVPAPDWYDFARQPQAGPSPEPEVGGPPPHQAWSTRCVSEDRKFMHLPWPDYEELCQEVAHSYGVTGGSGWCLLNSAHSWWHPRRDCSDCSASAWRCCTWRDPCGCWSDCALSFFANLERGGAAWSKNTSALLKPTAEAGMPKIRAACIFSWSLFKVQVPPSERIQCSTSILTYVCSWSPFVGCGKCACRYASSCDSRTLTNQMQFLEMTLILTFIGRMPTMRQCCLSGGHMMQTVEPLDLLWSAGREASSTSWSWSSWDFWARSSWWGWTWAVGTAIARDTELISWMASGCHRSSPPVESAWPVWRHGL